MRVGGAGIQLREHSIYSGPMGLEFSERVSTEAWSELFETVLMRSSEGRLSEVGEDSTMLAASSLPATQ